MARQEHALIHRLFECIPSAVAVAILSRFWKDVSEKISWNCVETYLKSVLYTKQGTPNSMVPASCQSIWLKSRISHANLRGPPRPLLRYTLLEIRPKIKQVATPWDSHDILEPPLLGCAIFSQQVDLHNFPGLLTFGSCRLHLEEDQAKTGGPKTHIFLSHLFNICAYIKTDSYTNMCLITWFWFYQVYKYICVFSHGFGCTRCSPKKYIS